MLESLISTLAVSAYYTKFTATLPLTRICILLLGEHPTPIVATLVLHLIAISLNISSSFSRKFELVSGWNILKVVLPASWDPNVHEAAFDILLGRKNVTQTSSATIACPHIVPAIFSALHRGLDLVAQLPQTTESTNGEIRLEGKFMILTIRRYSLFVYRFSADFIHGRVQHGDSCRRNG